MPITRRSEEPFYKPSVDASTEAEGRHSKSVQESEVHYRMYVHGVYTNVPLFA